LSREIPGYVGFFGAYETLKALLNLGSSHLFVTLTLTLNPTLANQARLQKDDTGEADTISVCIAGGVAGVVAWTISYPQDVIKSHIQLQKPGGPVIYKTTLFDGGFIDCGRHLIRQGGVASLFRGFLPCILRSVPANAAGFLAYEKACELLH